MKIVFIGGTQRGFLTLQSLVRLPVEIMGIISLRQDDHEVVRYEREIRHLADTHHIPCYETKWMKDRDYVDILEREWRPDLCLVVGCRILIPQSIYSIPPLGTLAVHDSLLPEYRGFAPLNWSIANGEDHVGATLFYLSEKMDGGDIVAQKRIPLHGNDDATMMYKRVCEATIDLVEQSLPLLAKGQALRIPQDYSTGSF